MSTKNLEVEFKYPAIVALSLFQDFCSNRDPEKFLIISGFDHFFAHKDDPESFYRHRVNTNENQLTFKRKNDKNNSFVREEHNIDLPLSVSQDNIASMVGVHGYVYNTSIFKNCFIYNYSYYTLVFYVVYDIDLKELGRFIEIEMKEDYKWTSSFEAFKELVVLEKLCKDLGTNPESRSLLSLFEMFKKEVK